MLCKGLCTLARSATQSQSGVVSIPCAVRCNTWKINASNTLMRSNQMLFDCVQSTAPGHIWPRETTRSVWNQNKIHSFFFKFPVIFASFFCFQISFSYFLSFFSKSKYLLFQGCSQPVTVLPLLLLFFFLFQTTIKILHNKRVTPSFFPLRHLRIGSLSNFKPRLPLFNPPLVADFWGHSWSHNDQKDRT